MKVNKKLRKIIAKVLLVIFAVLSFNVNVYADFRDIVKSTTDEDGTNEFIVNDIPSLQAESVIVVDLETGYTLYEKNIYQKLYPASITKVMTAILAIENLNLADYVTYSYDAVYTIEPGSSSAYMSEGEQITVEDSLYGLMLISGNDLANGLGEAVAGDMASFANMMTQKAKEIGCVNTNFKNAHGLHDEEHYTCAYDMARMASYAFKNIETFRTLISTERYTVAPTPFCKETRYWRNSNRFIKKDNEYYDEECLGGKTGYTDQAQATIVSFHKVHGRTILVVDMKAPSGQTFSDVSLICKHLRNMDPSYFAKLDEKYNGLVEAESASIAEAERQSLEALKEKEVSANVEEKTEDGGFPFVLKVLIVLAIVFGAFYVYITVQRNRMRARYRRKRRQIEMEMYYNEKRRER